MPVADAPPPPPPPLTAQDLAAIQAVPLPIGFSNRLAVRFCFLVASVASVLDAMPGVQLLGVVWSICAGFIAVVLYRKVTGQAMNVREGAKMGWICGVLNSLILTVLTTISVAANSAELNAVFKEQVRLKAPDDPAALALVDNPYFLAAGILTMLFFVFVVVSASSMLGGVLAAKSARDHRAPGSQPR